jgi:hypothetical protein
MYRQTLHAFVLSLALISRLPHPSQAYTTTRTRSLGPLQLRRSITPSSCHRTPKKWSRNSYKQQLDNDKASLIRLTTKESQDDDDDKSKIGILQKAKEKLVARPVTYLLIPCIAALVGWFTNYLAVQMIFYPISFWGIPIWRRPEVPLGLIGWQGIVPCKTKTMSIVLVDMVTSQLLTVKEAFGRLNPDTMAKLLAPRVPLLGQEVLADMAPKVVNGLPVALWNGLDEAQQSILEHINLKFLTNLVKDMQLNIDTIFNLESCVVSQMVQGKRLTLDE